MPSRLLHLLIACVVTTGLLYGPAVRVAAVEGDFGYMGPSYVGTDGNPTGENPESKLWWNDGFWWASMWSTTASQFQIFRLDVASQSWIATGTVLDGREGTRADTLWDAAAQKLYVSSHDSTQTTGPNASRRGMLWRFSYTAATDTYALDSGFPVDINQAASETLVIDKDSSGQLWAVWVQQTTSSSAVYRVFANRTICDPACDDADWGTPFEIPVAGAEVTRDDIASLASFDGRVGVMWSNQDDSAVYFATHRDADGDGTWETSRTAIQGPSSADDHINLKSLLVDDQNRIYAAVKTGHSSSESPGIMLLVRDPATGDWESHVVWQVKWDQTRPIVILDETADRIHFFAADEGGGTVYEKSSPMGSISFDDTQGTPVIRDANKPAMNDPTSTKQNVNSTTGLVVLASNDVSSTDRRYWHHYDPLNGSPPPNATPTAAADSYVTSADTRLDVPAPGVLDNDADTDGDALTAIKASDPANGSLVLNANGAFSYIPASGFAGTDSFTYTANDGTVNSSPATVTISVSAAGTEQTLTFTASDDAYVWDGGPTRSTTTPTCAPTASTRRAATTRI